MMLLWCSKPIALLHGYLVLLVCAGVVVFFDLIVNYGFTNVHHELEYLVPPLSIYFAFRSGSLLCRWLGFTIFLSSAFLFQKNTGYLVALLVIGYCVFFRLLPAWKGPPSLVKGAAALGLLICASAGLAGILFLLMHRETYLPSGNPEFRLMTYAQAWIRFVASPLWGTGFTEPAAEKFTGFDTGVSNNILPTHSDVLDLAAQGGLLALALWLWGLFRVGRLAAKTVIQPGGAAHVASPYAHMLACMSLAAVVVYAFNPILLQPEKSILIWTNLGFLVGLALRFGSAARRNS